MTVESQNNKHQAEKIKDSALNHMCTEVQKIIDNHLKGSDNRFSVMDYSREQITTTMRLLTGNMTEDDVIKQNEESQRKMNEIYDQILNESDYINGLKNLAEETRFELKSLQSDLQLQKELEG